MKMSLRLIWYVMLVPTHAIIVATRVSLNRQEEFPTPSYLQKAKMFHNPVFAIDYHTDILYVGCQVVQQTGRNYCVCKMKTPVGIQSCTTSKSQSMSLEAERVHDCRVKVDGLEDKSPSSLSCDGRLYTSETVFVPPRSNVASPAHQINPGSFEVPTWLSGSPIWSLPLYELDLKGETFYTKCSAEHHFKSMSCSCTVYGRNGFEPLACSTSSTPNPSFGDERTVYHCQIHLVPGFVKSSSELSFTKNERRDTTFANHFHDWPCSTSISSATPHDELTPRDWTPPAVSRRTASEHPLLTEKPPSDNPRSVSLPAIFKDSLPRIERNRERGSSGFFSDELEDTFEVLFGSLDFSVEPLRKKWMPPEIETRESPSGSEKWLPEIETRESPTESKQWLPEIETRESPSGSQRWLPEIERRESSPLSPGTESRMPDFEEWIRQKGEPSNPLPPVMGSGLLNFPKRKLPKLETEEPSSVLSPTFGSRSEKWTIPENDPNPLSPKFLESDSEDLRSPKFSNTFEEELGSPRFGRIALPHKALPRLREPTDLKRIPRSRLSRSTTNSNTF